MHGLTDGNTCNIVPWCYWCMGIYTNKSLHENDLDLPGKDRYDIKFSAGNTLYFQSQNFS